MKIGLLLRWESLWIGVHYSPNERRTCINVVPCVTIWITRVGGEVPKYRSLFIWDIG